MKTFGHRRPVRNSAGEVIADKSSPAAAITREPYAVLYSKARRVVVTLEAGDVLSFREHGRRGKWLLAVDSAFRYAVRCKANADAEAARSKKKGGAR